MKGENVAPSLVCFGGFRLFAVQRHLAVNLNMGVKLC